MGRAYSFAYTLSPGEPTHPSSLTSFPTFSSLSLSR